MNAVLRACAAPLRFVSRLFVSRSLGSLRSQLILWNVIALLLLLGGLGISCRYITLSFLMRSVDQELQRRLSMYQQPPSMRKAHEQKEAAARRNIMRLDGDADGDSGQEAAKHSRDATISPDPHDTSGQREENTAEEHLLHPVKDRYGTRLFYPDGRPELPDGNIVIWDAAALTRAQKGETVYSTVRVDDETVRALTVPGFDLHGRRGAAQTAYPLKEVYLAVAGVNSALLLLTPLGLIGAVWFGVALTNRVLRPVHHMTQEAGRIGAEDFSRRLPVSGSDEFSELAATFNGLLERLSAAYEEQKRVLETQRRFTADASHELKTPLTIIKGRSSLALSSSATGADSRRAFAEIDRAADTMARLVQDLLLLARSDEGRMGGDRIEILLREALESARRASFREGQAPVTLRIETETCVIGNEMELIRLFRNLLDNSAQYTPSDGRITVTARVEAGQSIVTVTDTGVGIAPEHLPHLGERFYRVDASRSRPTGGTGLGLSLCRSIALAHQGTLDFTSTPGVGTTVRVRLPLP